MIRVVDVVVIHQTGLWTNKIPWSIFVVFNTRGEGDNYTNECINQRLLNLTLLIDSIFFCFSLLSFQAGETASRAKIDRHWISSHLNWIANPFAAIMLPVGYLHRVPWTLYIPLFSPFLFRTFPPTKLSVCENSPEEKTLISPTETSKTESALCVYFSSVSLEWVQKQPSWTASKERERKKVFGYIMSSVSSDRIAGSPRKTPLLAAYLLLFLLLRPVTSNWM